MKLDEAVIRNVVEEVLGRLKEQPATTGNRAPSPQRGNGRGQGKSGVFACADEASAAANEAFLRLRPLGIRGRAKVVEIVKTLCAEKAREWGKLELDETRIGRLEHKVEKLQSIASIPGTEWLRPFGMSGDHGISMEEFTPFGVIGAVSPVTHSIPTLACNIVNMVAAGNSVVCNAHPGGARCAATAIAAFNDAIRAELGIENLVTIVEEPTLDSFNAICSNEHVRLLCVTGGPGVVSASMKSGKRAICAGPGNPPVVVDETARLDRAARAIIYGGAYDNNLLCIGEKQIFVVEAIYQAFLKELEAAGARRLNAAQLDRLTNAAFTREEKSGAMHAVLNRDLVGADASVLAREAGATVPEKTELLFAETDADHLFVQEEQMMPMVPVIRVRDASEGIEAARKSEHGYKHSSMIHSLNVERMTEMARALDSTLFIKNGSCLAGLGNGGEGYASFSIATTTGEGITTPLTFTRTRRCVMVDNLRIY